MTYELKPLTVKDYTSFYYLVHKNRSRLNKYFPNTVKELQTKLNAKSQLELSDNKRNRKEQFLFGIYASEKLIGYINVKNIDWEVLKAELGYFIDQDYEGKGIMTTQIQAIITYCFKRLGLLKIFLRIGQENFGSKIIAEKTGFIKEGILRNEFKLESGKLIDVEYYGILNN